MSEQVLDNPANAHKPIPVLQIGVPWGVSEHLDPFHDDSEETKPAPTDADAATRKIFEDSRAGVVLIKRVDDVGANPFDGMAPCEFANCFSIFSIIKFPRLSLKKLANRTC